MAIGDFETPLRDRATETAVSRWASAWWDLRMVAQILHSRGQLAPTPDNFVARRGTIDGAMVTYGRCFTDGTRAGTVDLVPMVNAMGQDAVDLHDEAMNWRHRHVAHRLDKSLERSSVNLLWGDFGTSLPTLRVRLVASLGPEDSIADRIADMSKALADLVWEQHLYPIQEELLARLGPVNLDRIKQKARPFTPPPQGEGTIGVTLDIGSLAPGQQA